MTSAALNNFLFQYQEFTNEVKNGKKREQHRVRYDRAFRQTNNMLSAQLSVIDGYIDDVDMESVSLFSKSIFEQLNPQHPTRKSWSDALKKDMLEEQNYECNNPRCRKHLATIHDCEFDHIVPHTIAFDTLGTTNLQILCPECNQSKGDKIVPWAVKILAKRIQEKGSKVIGAQDIVFEQQSFFDDNPDTPSTLVSL